MPVFDHYGNQRCLVLRRSSLLGRIFIALPITRLYSVFAVRVGPDVMSFIAVVPGGPK